MSFDFRGLNSPYEQSKVLDYMHSNRIYMALLQETHLKREDSSRAQNHLYKPVVASTDGTCTKGVLILMRRSIDISVNEICCDKKGHLACCCTSIQGKKKWHLSVYIPEKCFFLIFFLSITSQLWKLNDYQRYISSDMNVVITHYSNKSYMVLASAKKWPSKALNG